MIEVLSDMCLGALGALLVSALASAVLLFLVRLRSNQIKQYATTALQHLIMRGLTPRG